MKLFQIWILVVGAAALLSPVDRSWAIDAGRSLYIEGYPGSLSYEPGDELELHLSTTSPTFTLEFKRLGKESPILHTEKEVKGGTEYGFPETASSKGCHWPVGFRFKIPDDWKSGYYQVTLRIKDGGGKFSQRNSRTAEGSLFFVLRSKNPGAGTKVLLQLATNTYNAYNNWGGSSLYGYHGRAGLQGHEVSFHRPQSTQFYKWEYEFVKWAEANGIEIDYCTNMDLQERPELLSRYRLMLSIGHDEYWSSEMRDTAEAFVAEGGNIAFLSGNTCCWQIRWQEETKSMLCWKQWYNQDPIFSETTEHRKLATLWGHHLVGRPENELTGVGFLHGGYHRSHGQFMDGKASFTVHRPDHWLLEGTKLKQNDEFGGKDTIVGYECDGCDIEWREGLPFPTHKDGTPKSFTIVGTCPAKWAPGDAFWYDQWPGKDHSGHAVLGTWKSAKGGAVVTTGTTDWTHGLRGGDPAVERITRNILDRLGK